MPCSGMLKHVALVRNDVSEERITPIIWVTRIGHLGTTLAVTRNRSTLRRNSTRRNNPEGGIPHSHRRENLKSYMVNKRVLRDVVPHTSATVVRSWEMRPGMTKDRERSPLDAANQQRPLKSIREVLACPTVILKS
jgi:hypothetical protein